MKTMISRCFPMSRKYSRTDNQRIFSTMPVKKSNPKAGGKKTPLEGSAPLLTVKPPPPVASLDVSDSDYSDSGDESVMAPVFSKKQDPLSSSQAPVPVAGDDSETTMTAPKKQQMDHGDAKKSTTMAASAATQLMATLLHGSKRASIPPAAQDRHYRCCREMAIAQFALRYFQHNVTTSRGPGAGHKVMSDIAAQAHILANPLFLTELHKIPDVPLVPVEKTGTAGVGGEGSDSE